MGKLHELLAVEDSLLTKFKKLVEEGVDTFSKKEHLFKGATIRQESAFEKDDIQYKEYPDITETVPVQETVASKLDYIAESASHYFDSVASKDATNCTAKSDLVIDGTVVISNVPAVTLLFIENKFKSLRNLLESIKTLDQAKVWAGSSDQLNVFRAPETSKVAKVPVEEHVIIVQSTDKHPAQVAKTTKHQIVATRYQVEMSGLITSARKSDLMGKCDKIINAAKQARQRANDISIDQRVVGKHLFDYLLK